MNAQAPTFELGGLFGDELARTLVCSLHPGVELLHVALQMIQRFVLPEMTSVRAVTDSSTVLAVALHCIACDVELVPHLSSSEPMSTAMPLSWPSTPLRSSRASSCFFFSICRAGSRIRHIYMDGLAIGCVDRASSREPGLCPWRRWPQRSGEGRASLAGSGPACPSAPCGWPSS